MVKNSGFILVFFTLNCFFSRNKTYPLQHPQVGVLKTSTLYLFAWTVGNASDLFVIKLKMYKNEVSKTTNTIDIENLDFEVILFLNNILIF